MKTTIEYDGVVFTLLFQDIMPQPDAEEIASLDESLRDFGPLNRIVVNKYSDDKTGAIINEVVAGCLRLSRCKELGIKLESVPIAYVELHTEDEKLSMAIMLNSSCRKWNQERWVATAHRLEKLGWSVRKIARHLVISKSKAGYLLNEPDPNPEIEPSEYKIGDDGKLYDRTHKDSPVQNWTGESDHPSEAEGGDQSSVVWSADDSDGASEEGVSTPSPPEDPEKVKDRLIHNFDKHYLEAFNIAKHLGRLAPVRKQWDEIYLYFKEAKLPACG